MEENERKNNIEKNEIPNHIDDDEVIVKYRNTSLRKKKVSSPEYNFTGNPMSPNQDGKTGLFYQTLSLTSRLSVLLFIIAAIAFFVFLFMVLGNSFSGSLSFGKKTPEAVLKLKEKYGIMFYAKDYKSSSQLYKQYTVYPEENKKILFTLTDTMESAGTHIYSENYLMVAYNYYIEDYTGDLSGLSIILEGNSPKITLETTFDGLNTDLKKLYDLKQFLLSKSSSFKELNFNIKLEHYYENNDSGEYITLDSSLEDYILTEKNFYIRYLEENDFDLSEVPSSDIENYRPQTMKVQFSYKKIPEKTYVSHYDFEKQDYILDMSIVLDFMKNVEFINKENLHFYYNSVELKVNKELTVAEFEEIFDANVKLNIKGKNLTIYHN